MKDLLDEGSDMQVNMKGATDFFGCRNGAGLDRESAPSHECRGRIDAEQA